MVPLTILFIACDAVDIASQIRLVDEGSCPEFDRWLHQRRSGIAIDFRRIQRLGFSLRCLEDYIVNLSRFEERPIICGSDEVPNQIYHRIEDEFLVFVKSNPLSENVEESHIEQGIEKLINVRHPCIAAPIGFIGPVERGSRRELKIVRMYFEGCSLTEVVSLYPVWFTSTVKAKAVSGLVLGLRFAHSLGLAHGHLTGNNILFNSDHCIQVVDLNLIVWKGGDSEIEIESGNGNEEGTQLVGFSGGEQARYRDIQAFASILFELLFGCPPQGEASIPKDIPDFVYRIIKSGLSPVSSTSCSFNDILNLLKQNKFKIEDGVDSAEVSAFVSWVELVEYLDQ
jgi:serine/threonine protein kinase